MRSQVGLKGIRKWRRRGYYSERRLCKNLQALGFEAVRIPVSNPSMNPLPDVIARKSSDVYAFEVKNAKRYACFPCKEITKLFQYLEKSVPLPESHLHAVLAAHLGKNGSSKNSIGVTTEAAESRKTALTSDNTEIGTPENMFKRLSA